VRNNQFALPIHLALQYNAPYDAIDALLNENPTSCRHKDWQGCHPLHVAVKHNLELNVINRLLQSHNAACLNQDMEGRTPLHYAAMNSNPGMIRTLVQANKQAGIIEDKDGRLPVHLLLSRWPVEASSDHIDSLQLLLKVQLHSLLYCFCLHMMYTHSECNMSVCRSVTQLGVILDDR